jgi:hypothetical protein
MKKLIGVVLIAMATLMASCTVSYAQSPNRTFMQEVAEGVYWNYSIIEKFGENPEIDTATTPEVIWSRGGMYYYSTTADIDSVSGDNAADTHDLTIQGLDADWKPITQTVTVTGLTRVPIPIPMIRVFRAWNSNSTEFLGHVYIYVNTALNAGVPIDMTQLRAEIHLDITGLSSGQTEMAVYTIPAGYVGYLYQGYTGISRGGNISTAEFVPAVRDFGGVWRTVFREAAIGQGSSQNSYQYPFPLVMPAKTDIQVTCVNVTANGTGAFAGFTILLRKIYKD